MAKRNGGAASPPDTSAEVYGHEQSEVLHRIDRANILTINQTIPTNGCAGVTISAETRDMVEDLESMMTRISAAEGVLKFEVQAA